MKKFVLIAILTISSTIISAQFVCSCLPEGITFNTQEQIDSFHVNYPGCTEIEGFVTIHGYEITNLNGLSVLTGIGGKLGFYNCNSLYNLAGFDNLTFIGGDLVLFENQSLTSLAGIDNVSFIGGNIGIVGNDSLISLTGLENLTSINGSLQIGAPFYQGNPSLTSLSGLNNVDSIGGYLKIINNPAISSLTGLENIVYIGEELVISSTFSLTSIMELENLISIEGGLEISFNYSLSTLTGLDNLVSISGDLWIFRNAGLTSLAGLDNIEAGSISSVNIYKNDSLTTCHVESICEYLSSPIATVEIFDNASGCNNPEEVEEYCESFGENEYLVKNSGFTVSCYPNPCSNITHLRYTNEEQRFLICDLFKIDGSRIGRLHNEEMISGSHEVIIDLSNQPGGIYIIRIQAGGDVLTRKLVKFND